jgi:hypothetical protein
MGSEIAVPPSVSSTRYPIHTHNGIVSVPPTKSGMFVEMFARQVASLLGVEYLPVLAKVRLTHEQFVLSRSHIEQNVS